VIGLHLGIFVLTGYALAQTRSGLLRLVLTLISGTSLFALASLVHSASRYQLARRAWLNDMLGNLAGTLFATPVSAYRALDVRHHLTTGRDGGEFRMLKSRWMILFGTPAAIALLHRHAWCHLRGAALGRYLIETSAMFVLGASVFLLPRPVREWSLFGPLIVVDIMQNVCIATGRFAALWAPKEGLS
jgi:fatty acid desaturase